MVLDNMGYYVQCLYGRSNACGVVTSTTRCRNGINQYLAGYIISENTSMRFRPTELTLEVRTFVSDFMVGGEENDVPSAKKNS